MKNNTKRKINQIKKVLKKYQVVKFAYLFGSYNIGREREVSDIDVSLFFDPNLSNNQQNRIEEKIELEILQNLGLNSNNKVHLVILNQLSFNNPLLEKEIVYEGRLIDIKDHALRAHFEAKTIHRWCDWQSHQKKFNQATFKNLGRSIKPFKIYA